MLTFPVKYFPVLEQNTDEKFWEISPRQQRQPLQMEVRRGTGLIEVVSVCVCVCYHAHNSPSGFQRERVDCTDCLQTASR